MVHIGGFERVQNRGQMANKFNVDDGPDNLGDLAGGDAFGGSKRLRLGGHWDLSVETVQCFCGRRRNALKRLGSRNDFDQFLGNLGLTRAVILFGQRQDQIARIAGGVIHGAHLAGIKARLVFQ